MFRVNAFKLRFAVTLRSQDIDRQLIRIRVTHPLGKVGVRELLSFNQMMKVVSGVVAEPPHVDVLEGIHHLQRGNSLAVGR